MAMVIARFEVYLVRMDPTEGHEIRKTRPGLVITPDEMNRHLATVIVAPLTTRTREYPMRVSLHFGGKDGQVALDQVRAVDKRRLVKRLGKVDSVTASEVLEVLARMFAP